MEMSTPLLLDQLTTDLNKLAQEGKLDPVIGREAEIENLIGVLCRRKDSNAVLIGPAGISQTQIVESVAQQISDETAPPALLGKRVVQLDLGLLVHRSQYPSFGDLMIRLVQDLRQSRCIVFIGEMKYITGSTAVRPELNLELLMKLESDRGEVSFIGEMLEAEFDEWKRSDSPLAHRFQPIHVRQLSVERTIAMLQGSKKHYEDHYHIEIVDDAIEAVVRLSEQHSPDRALPDKAYDLLDAAASGFLTRTRLKTLARASELEQEIMSITIMLDDPPPEHSEEELKRLNRRKATLSEELASLPLSKRVERRLTAEHVAETLVQWTDSPTDSGAKK
jgi:ATP-dependent Clp protease ATP-binding subunit ClpC